MNTAAVSENLDPKDFSSIRKLGHRIMDDMLDVIEQVEKNPVWQEMPKEIQSFFEMPAPREGLNADEVYGEVFRNMIPYRTGNIHPRFWGWVMGGGTVTAQFAEFIKATININAGGHFHSAALAEKQLIRWCCEFFGFPSTASGLMVSGGSMANFVGLTVARNTMAGFDVRKKGVAASPQRMCMYASRETHSSVQKALEILGLGNGSLRLIEVNEDFTINIEALRKTIAADRQQGLYPICLIGNAGTVATAGMDDLSALADVAREENCWFHVDGAFGGLAVLSPALKHLVNGIDRADSIAFDMHKWMYLPYEAGCVLVKDESAHRHAFSLTPDYLVHAERGLASGEKWFSEYAIELSRGFNALKGWMNIREHGLDKIGRLIWQNVKQAQYLGDLVRANTDLELLAPVTLNIVCFRFRGHVEDNTFLNELNKELVIRIHESGIAVTSYATINGKYAIRVANTNHRSRFEDFELLVKTVIEIGHALMKEMKTK